MLQKIKLKNFQSIKDVTFSLGKVTVLRGASDVGKSAVIRALNCFFNNSFNPEFAHNGNLPFGIAIQKNNRVTLGRRTPKGVEYLLDSVPYSKTAKKVPSDISHFLGIYPYAIDVDMSVFFQIQKQWDQPFLLTESSITVAKIIGRVSNLNIVLMAMREMYASQLEIKQTINSLYARKKDLSFELSKFSNFDSYEQDFMKAERLDSEIADLSDRRSKLLELITRAEDFNSRLRTFNKESLEAKRAFSLLEDLMSFVDLKDCVQKLSEKRLSPLVNVEKALSLIETIQQLRTSSEEVSSMLSFDPEPRLTELGLMLSRIQAFDSLDFSRRDTLVSIVEVADSFNARVKEFKEASASFKLLESSYEDEYHLFMEGRVICPFSKLEMQDFCKKNLSK